MQPIDLNPHDLEIVLAILRKFVPDREVWAFGSRVKWTAKPFSDLDLAIVGEQPLPINIAADLAEAFDESELPIKVDVVDWAATSDAFRKIIEKDKVVIQPKQTSAVSPAPTFLNGLSLGVRGQFSECKLSDLAKFRNGKGLGENSYDHEGRYPVFGSTGQIGRTNELLNAAPVIAIGRVGANCGSVISVEEPSWVTDNAIVVTPKAGVDRRFLFYRLYSLNLRETATGSAQPLVTQQGLSSIKVLAPADEDEQRKIGLFFHAIDERNRLIERQRLTLYFFAVSLFKSWFLDFIPTRSKVELRLPFGMDVETAALFPSRIENSDLGEIPVGWRATTLVEIVTERTGKIGNGNEHVVLSAVASGELKRSDEHFTKQVYSQDTSKYKRVEQWDYAYNPSRINIGSIGMLEEPIVGAVSPVYTVLRPAEGYEWFLRFFLDLPQTKEVINQFCSGSVRQSLSFKDFAAIPVVLPPKEIAEAFTRRWQELNGLRQRLAMQSGKLAEVRDTLLPKLMSGELRVHDELIA